MKQWLHGDLSSFSALESHGFQRLSLDFTFLTIVTKIAVSCPASSHNASRRFGEIKFALPFNSSQ
jgi:hypothetical protein